MTQPTVLKMNWDVKGQVREGVEIGEGGEGREAERRRGGLTTIRNKSQFARSPVSWRRT